MRDDRARRVRARRRRRARLAGGCRGRPPGGHGGRGKRLPDDGDPARGLSNAMQRLVVVGASLAGLRAAQAARSAGHDGGLVLIGQEPPLPYTRPPLSKEYLQGKQAIEESAFRLGELDVEGRLGTAAPG